MLICTNLYIIEFLIDLSKNNERRTTENYILGHELKFGVRPTFCERSFRDRITFRITNFRII